MKSLRVVATEILVILGATGFLLASGAVHGDGTEHAAPAPNNAAGGNVLLIVADDLSVSDLASYGVHPDAWPGLTPNLDRLMSEGVVFERAWAQPLCSATRAAILTGRTAFRTGIGCVIERCTDSLRPDELTLPEALRSFAPVDYATAAFGKWHLEKRGSSIACPPTDVHGFDVFGGSLFARTRNPCDSTELLFSGVTSGPDQYMPAMMTDSAIAWIDKQSDPWFCFLAPQAPYDIPHVPPRSLQTRVPASDGCDPCAEGQERACYEASLQALDTKIGDLIASLGPTWQDETTIVFIADNGTPRNVMQHGPRSHGKGSLFEGGVNVPLVIAGRGVDEALKGTRSTAFVHALDLFRTVTTLAGIAQLPAGAGEDSIDLSPLLSNVRTEVRPMNFAERIVPGVLHDVAVRGERFKLIYRCSTDQARGLYDLERDPAEAENLLSEGIPPRGTPAGDALERLIAAIPAEIVRGQRPRGRRTPYVFLLLGITCVAGWMLKRRTRKRAAA